MADHRRVDYLNLLYYAFCFVISANVVNSDGLPRKEQMETLVRDLSSTFKSRFNQVTGYTVLTSAYDDQDNILRSKFGIKFNKVDPKVLVDDFAKALSEMFVHKMEALNRSVLAAEEAARNHTWNDNIKEADFECLKSKEILPNETGLVYNERFKQKIIPDKSSVHIPVEIYDGDVEILNGLQWSAHLDKVFAENYNKDPDILWQYFGSQSGFMRTFPASRWDTGEEVDLYDVRRRPWYTQGSSSPKDMLILIDTSGSVHGEALELIKVAVKSLLDTLGENDFINIAQFSKEAQFVSKCFNGSFVQANYRNKQKLINDVDEISAEGMANFIAGLEFAFEQFIKLENETEGRRGAGCNRMIMLLTDGGTELAEDVFKKYNPKDKQNYRVFTYAVGPTANPISAIRWMACANKGYFSQIPAMGAIRSKVQEYVDVISRPLALYRSKHELWTSIYQGLYQDAEYMRAQVEALATYSLSFDDRVKFSIKYDPWGLGMMITVTLPVYNKTSPNGTTDQTILGVMGIDVTTDAMLKFAPLRKFGPNGFPFALNANGYIVFHPNLKIEKELKDPPNVDFLEVEVETEDSIELRRRMINAGSDIENMEMDTFTLSNDQRHVDIEIADRKREYSFRRIDRTTFSLGVSVPKYHKYHLMLETDVGVPVGEQNRSLLNDTHTAMLIPDWEFYEGFLAGNDTTGTVLDLQEALENPANYKWNNELINHLLFDITVTSKIDGGYWRMQDVGLGDGLVGAFISTVGGLTKIYPKREDLVSQFVNERDTWKANYFKRAIDAPHMVFSAPYVLDPVSEEPLNDSIGVGDVTIVKSIVITNKKMDPNLDQQPDYKAAVLGGVFTHQFIRDKMIEISNQKKIGNCGDPYTTACYLLDDGAFVIATNQEQYYTSVGRFFGRVDPEVMLQLYNSTFFQRMEQYDYSAICIINDKDDTSAANINIPFVAIFYEFLTFNWWSSVMTWTMTNFNIYNMLYTAPAYGSDTDGVKPVKTKDCVTLQAQYYYTREYQFMEGQTDCEFKNINCSRDFVAHYVENTNLILVITEAEKDGCDKCKLSVDPKDLIQEPVEPSAAEVDAHFCNQKPRYRKSTSQCYDNHPSENTDKCAGSLTHPVSMTIVFLVSIATTLLINR